MPAMGRGFALTLVLPSLAGIQSVSAETPELIVEPWISTAPTQEEGSPPPIGYGVEIEAEDSLLRPSTSPVRTAGVEAAIIDKAGTEREADLPSEWQAPVDQGYSGKVFLRQAKSIPWRLGGATAAITLTGIGNWDWGSSSFHFRQEGWFGEDTASLGMDKLGHAYSAFVLTEFFTDGMDGSQVDRSHAPYTAGLLTMGLMTYIEVFDGFSKEHGFSGEDMVVDAAGVLFSIARRKAPGLREKVDFRLLYTPDQATIASFKCFPRPHCDRDGRTARSPITDYSNQRYLLAFKLAGFKPLDRTPFRFLEVHAGYYGRGFTAEAAARGDPLRRRIFFGVGVNVGELLVPRPRGWTAKAARSAFEYLQVPYTAVHTH